MAARLNTCTTIEQRGVVRFFVGKKYGCSKGYAQRNAAHAKSSGISAGPCMCFCDNIALNSS
jgi:hypothetical protein